MVGLVDRHLFCPNALLLMNAFDAATDGTIPQQPSLVLKIRVLYEVLPPVAYVKRAIDRLQHGALFKCVPLHRSRCRQEKHEIVHKFQERMEWFTNKSDKYIYMSWRLSRQNNRTFSNQQFKPKHEM